MIKDLNHKLMYENTHQKCVLQMKNDDIAKLREDLLTANIKYKVDPLVIEERETLLRGEITLLKRQIQEMENQCKQSETYKDSWKERCWDSLEKLDEAHRLVTVHLHNSARFREESKAAEKEKSETEEQLDKTTKSLARVNEQLTEMKQKHDGCVDTWNKEREQLILKEEDLDSKVRDLMARLEEQTAVVGDKSTEIEKLVSDLHAAQAILNIEKVTSESQTTLNMLKVTDEEVQAVPQIAVKETQSNVEMSVSTSQTIDPAMCSTGVQTEVPDKLPVQTMETQTDHPELVTSEMQTKPQEFPQESKTFNVAVQTEADGHISQTEAFCVHKTIDEEVSSKTGQFSINQLKLDNDVSRNTNYMDNQNLGVVGDVLKHSDCAVKHLKINKVGKEMIQEETLDIDCEKSLNNNMKGGLKEYPITNFGICAPKIDIVKSLNMVELVDIDPEEFSIQLTQDEQRTKDTEDKNGNIDQNINEEIILIDDQPEGYRVFSNLNKEKNNKIEISHTSKMYDEKVDEKQNPNGNSMHMHACGPVSNLGTKWTIEERVESKLTLKGKSSKHKLTKQNVQEQFQKFDMAKEQFESFRGMIDEECSRSKMLKLCKPLDNSDCELGRINETKIANNGENIDNYENFNCAYYQEKLINIPSNYVLTSSLIDKQKINSPYYNGGMFKHNKTLLNKSSSGQTKFGDSTNGSELQMNAGSLVVNVDDDQAVVQKGNFEEFNQTNLLFSTSDLSPVVYPSLNRSLSSLQNNCQLLNQNSASMPVASTVSSCIMPDATFGLPPDVPSQLDSVSRVHIPSATVEGPLVTDAQGDKIVDPISTVKPASVASSSEANIKETLKEIKETGLNGGVGRRNQLQVPKLDCQVQVTALPGNKAPAAKIKKLPASTPDFLLKYREIVSKIKPSKKQTNTWQKNDRATDVSPSSDNKKEDIKPHVAVAALSTTELGRTRRVSPRNPAPKSILKGLQEKDRRGWKVSWSEDIPHKEF